MHLSQKSLLERLLKDYLNQNVFCIPVLLFWLYYLGYLICFAVLDDHVCLLDCIALDLQEMDIFAAERLPCYSWDSGQKPEAADLIFPSYSVRRIGDNLLKDCCRLKLKVERNLDKYAFPYS